MNRFKRIVLFLFLLLVVVVLCQFFMHNRCLIVGMCYIMFYIPTDLDHGPCGERTDDISRYTSDYCEVTFPKKVTFFSNPHIASGNPILYVCIFYTSELVFSRMIFRNVFYLLL